MNGQAVKVSDQLMAAARAEAGLMSRSVARQIEHWAELGRAIEQSGMFTQRRITDFLEGRIPYDSLTPVEGTLAVERLIESLEKLPEHESLLQYLRESGVPRSGIIESTGQILRVLPDGRREQIGPARKKPSNRT